MNFNEHSKIKGEHAFLSASKYHWINYDAEKLERTYILWRAKERGTALHEYAAKSIELGIKLPKTSRTLNMYINDAIGYRMTPEQPLYYSENCFGTADAICYRSRKLRIHDLKTGETPASIHQLEIYAALFFLEYKIDPFETETELRIYQNDSVQIENPDPEVIKDIMDKIIEFDILIDKIKAGE